MDSQTHIVTPTDDPVVEEKTVHHDSKGKPSNFSKTWKRLNKKQRLSVFSLFFAAAALPVLVIASVNQALYQASARPIPATPPISGVPTISTLTLPEGTVGEPYSAQVEGYDAGNEGVLVMTAEGLPDGLQFGRCQLGHFLDKQTIKCQIIGKIYSANTYQVTFDLTDGTDTTQKILDLVTNAGATPRPRSKR